MVRCKQGQGRLGRETLTPWKKRTNEQEKTPKTPMERRRHALGLLGLCCLFAFMAVAVVTGLATEDFFSNGGQGTAKPSCSNKNVIRNLVLVSTMDGKVSALNVDHQGALEWSIETGETPLVSSSIGDLEVVQEGVKSRIIPSLGGTLFQYDGQSIKPMQIDADLLMSASFRMGDDTYIVGGKETVTYGINLSTGKLMYVCAINGCTRLGGESKAGNTLDDDVLVIVRQTKTIRAVEMRTGYEKWNFSVGQHEVSLIQDAPDIQDHKRINRDLYEGFSEGFGDEDASICDYNEEDHVEDYREQPSHWNHDRQTNIQLRLLVPEGVVMAVNRDRPGEVVWTHKFDSAIATAWSIRGGDLEQISIFDEPAVPALQLTEAGSPYREDNALPLLYIGEYENQFYCQESAPMQRQITDALNNASPSDNALAVMPVIRWRPYIATARSRTPAALGGVNPLQLEYERRQAESRGLTTWHQHYPYDNGYYLFPDSTPLNPENSDSESDYAIFYNVAEAMPSLWIWWKEVLAISLSTAFLFNFVIFKYYGRFFPSNNNQTSSVQDGVPIGSEVEEKPADILSMSSSTSGSTLQTSEFSSRYCSEFDQKVCLGKGGFGVVFEAVNKMDDCSYAVKRIALKNSDKARERVMREVKALAKLDHSGIVRYYQAWFESPPQGWQEEKDRQLLNDLPSSLGDPTNEPLSTHHGVTNPLSAGRGDGADHNPLNPFMGPGENPLRQLDWELTQRQVACDSKKRGSSSGFQPLPGNPDLSFEDQENGHSKRRRSKFFLEESVSIEFRNSDWENSASESGVTNPRVVPFGQYGDGLTTDLKDTGLTEDSFSVVFEDSGCGNKSEEEGDAASGHLSNTDHELSSSLPELGSHTLWSRTRKLSHSSSSPAKSLRQDGTFSGTPDKLSTSLPARPQSLALSNTDSKTKSQKEEPSSNLYLYIQMQLCRRETLKDWLSENTLNRDRKILLDIFDQIVSAVDYIHDCGMMHRDLKPSNIFFSLDGSVKVGDFGLVTAFEEQPQMTSKDQTPMFNQNITNQVGTKLYMSPEQGDGRHYTHKVDIFSLGLILFELFYPFSTQMERILLLQDLRRSIFPTRFIKELPDVMSLIRQLLAENPVERPSTKDIQQNPLLKDFEVARQILNRVRPRPRTNTLSTSESSNSEECFVTT